MHMPEHALTDPFRIIAIDGGAASGKSSTARELAKLLHFLHVDTGSHYRAITYRALQANIDPEQTSAVSAFLHSLQLGSVIAGNLSRITFAGKPLPDAAIRSQPVNDNVSRFASIPEVRNAVRLYQQQQVDLARSAGFAGIIMEGRDIGTVILPYAHLKVFLSADPSTRQQRRSQQGAAETIAHRDYLDSSRSVAPLRPAADAIIIDNSQLPLQQVVAQIRSLIP